MKRRHRHAVLYAVLVGILATATGGCAALTGGAEPTPLAKVDIARQSYVTSLQVLTPLIEAGVIKDKDTLQTLLTVRKQVAADLDAAERHARAGNGVTFQFLMDRITAALLTFEAEAAKRKVGG